MDRSGGKSRTRAPCVERYVQRKGRPAGKVGTCLVPVIGRGTSVRVGTSVSLRYLPIVEPGFSLFYRTIVAASYGISRGP